MLLYLAEISTRFITLPVWAHNFHSDSYSGKGHLYSLGFRIFYIIQLYETLYVGQMEQLVNITPYRQFVFQHRREEACSWCHGFLCVSGIKSLQIVSHRITGQHRVKLVPEDHRQSLKLTRFYRVFLCSVIGWWSDADSGRATSYCSGRSRTYGLIPSPRLISHSLRKFVLPFLLFARVSNSVTSAKV